MTELQYSPAKKWQTMPFEQAVEIFDTYRSPINSDCRNKRVNGKSQSDLYPYYGATGQVGWIDGYLLDGEYVLLGEDGAPFLDSLASKAYLVHGKVWVNNHAHILKSKYNNKFLLYYLNQIDYKPLVTGTTRLKLTQAAMKNIAIPTPPLPEQDRIVARIEELFSDLDKGVEALQTIKAQLKVYRLAVLKEAFDTIPNKTFTQLLDLIIGTPQNGLYKPSTFYGSGTLILRIDGFYEGKVLPVSNFKRVTLSKSEIETYSLNESDIVINRVNSMPYLGKCGLIKKLSESVVFESNIMRLSVDVSKVIPEYLTLFLTSHDGRSRLIKNAKQAVNQASINQTDVLITEIPICSLTLQEKIVSHIESRLSICDKIEQTVDESLGKAESLRQSILKKAFEGRL